MIGYLRLPLSIGTDRRPFVPQKETLIRAAAWSASCHKRKWPTNSTIRTGVCLPLWLPGLRREAGPKVRSKNAPNAAGSSPIPI